MKRLLITASLGALFLCAGASLPTAAEVIQTTELPRAEQLWVAEFVYVMGNPALGVAGITWRVHPIGSQAQCQRYLQAHSRIIQSDGGRQLKARCYPINQPQQNGG